MFSKKNYVALFSTAFALAALSLTNHASADLKTQSQSLISQFSASPAFAQVLSTPRIFPVQPVPGTVKVSHASVGGFLENLTAVFQQNNNNANVNTSDVTGAFGQYLTLDSDSKAALSLIFLIGGAFTMVRACSLMVKSEENPARRVLNIKAGIALIIIGFSVPGLMLQVINRQEVNTFTTTVTMHGCG